MQMKLNDDEVSTVCLAASLICFGCGILFLTVQATLVDSYPSVSILNPNPSTFTALVGQFCAGVEIFAYLACPRNQGVLRLFTLVLAALNIWLGVESGVNFLRNNVPAFRHWVDSMPFLPG
jgi:uncharacterized membrane protein YdcZ (DUF606 family)